MPLANALTVVRPLGLLLSLLMIPAAHAATITITTAEDELNADGDCSLREAIAAANTDAAVDACTAGSGADAIQYSPTLVGAETVLTGGHLDVTSTISIIGWVVPNVVTMTLNGNGASRIFRVASGASLTLNQFILTNGRADVGGAILAESGSTLVLDVIAAAGNQATGAAGTQGGGVVYADGATVTITTSRFVSNAATGAAGSGGAVFNKGGTMTLVDTRIETNTANRAGGGIEANAGTTVLTNVSLSGNNAGTAPGNGGGLHITGTGTVTVTGGMATNNMAVEGGGLWCSSGCTMTIDGTALTGNMASGSDGPTQGGGGLYNDGMLTVMNATLTGNQATGTAGSGGGILNVGGTLTVTAGMLRTNSAIRAGGGIETNGGTVTLNDVDFTSNTAGASPGNGGALHVTGAGTVTATDGEVRTNTAAREGGGFWNSTGTMTLTNTLFDGNAANGTAADDGGGALFNNGGAMILTDVTAQNNTAVMGAGSGGGILTLGGTLDMTRGLIDANQANRAGAGIENAGGTVTIVGTMVTNNLIPTASTAPGNGGGLHSGGGSVTINGGVFSGNTANEGGGLWSNGFLLLRPGGAGPSVVQNNIARGNDATQGGGGVYAETGADVRLMDVQVTGNRATGTSGSGGGLFVADGSAAIVSGSVLSMNQANRAGAGIEVADDGATPAGTAIVLTWTTLDGNTIATAMPGNGGGIHIGGAGVATIRKSTISNNVANEGGGVWVAGSGTLDLALSTVSGNTSVTEGGGVYDNGGASSATIMLASATIAGNTAASGGGLFSQSTDGASFTIDNTIVADNTAPTGPDCAGMIRSGGYNLIETTAGCTVSGMTATNVTGMDPMLGPLADNGGPTFTHLPAAGSPAVDAGQTNYKVDQRDFLRAVGQEDIGSVERGAMPVDGEPDAPQGEPAFAMGAPAPNPARGQAAVRFTLAETQAARVTLHDLLGRQIAVLFEGDAQAGAEQTVRVPLDGLAPGIYLLRLESAGQAALQRLTVVR